MQSELSYQLALTLIPSVGPVQARLLLEKMEPAAIFSSSKEMLEKIEGIGTVRAGHISAFRNFKRVEQELRFIESARIRPLFYTDPFYPARLLNCYDAPVLLYYKGEANLNAARLVAIIGTRSNTVYGKQVTEQLVNGLAGSQIGIVSGLAVGIDAIAHRAALVNGLPTVGVLGHGLDQIYPSIHRALAADMVRSGGALLTEFPSGTKPDRFNFPMRNRIVAGLSDVVVVSETRVKGGSMITAELANGYNREVCVFPGRVNDPSSGGCNQLIRTHKAALISDTDSFLEQMGWNDGPGFKPPAPPGLAMKLGPDEQLVVDILKKQESMQIDMLYRQTGLDAGRTAAAILNLELNNHLLSLPGKVFRLARP